jgi:uncharacterized phage protein (TIGR02218 family)
MAYADQENSIQDGAPYFLYEFTVGSDSYRFSDYPEDITWNSLLWSSFSIKHTEVKQSNELSKNAMTVTIPLSGDFADIFKGWSPDQMISFTLRRGHFGASDTLVYWKGRIASHNLKKQTVELKCESIFTSMRRPGIRARYQRNCRHPLYGRGCNLDKSDFALAGAVTSVSGLTLTISAASGESDGWFDGGIAEFADGSYRLILSHVGNQIVINRSSRYIVNGAASSGYGNNYGLYYGGIGVILYPGCDRTLTTCLNKFNNLDNNGGYKWIPSKNPMGGSSIV